MHGEGTAARCLFGCLKAVCVGSVLRILASYSSERKKQIIAASLTAPKVATRLVALPRERQKETFRGKRVFHPPDGTGHTYRNGYTQEGVLHVYTHLLEGHLVSALSGCTAPLVGAARTHAPRRGRSAHCRRPRGLRLRRTRSGLWFHSMLSSTAARGVPYR